MAKKKPDDQQVEAAVKLFRSLPVKAQIGIAILAVVVVVALYASGAFRANAPTPRPPSAGSPAGEYQFAFWNVENLFDDHDDARNSIDDPYDNWFAHNPADRQLKYDHLSDAILKLNGGKGPDILGCCEVESIRAAELLKDALNAKLPPGVPRYEYLAMKELAGNAGRFIAPCVISRLPLDESRTKLPNSRYRVLQTVVTADGADLNLVVSHWTSQISQKKDATEGGRYKYAEYIYDDFASLAKTDPAVDFLACGDFNDTPDSEPVVKVLHATGDRAAVTVGAVPPRLFDLMAGKPADRFGTLWHDGKPMIYDHIVVSPGLLDGRGWGCDPDSVRAASDGLTRPGATRREPWRFGNQHDTKARGYADHFPVVVNLKVGGSVKP